MTPFQSQLSEHLAKFHTAPILFIGSGMSRRFIGLETWKALLETMHGKIGLNKPFGYYLTQSTLSDRPDLTVLASLLGDEFSETWWTSDLFKESRTEYETDARTKNSPIKYEICKYILSKGLEFQDGIESEIELLRKCQVDSIITTNWDTLIESIFPDYTPFIGQEQLIFNEILSIGEVYKIHGCVTNPESLLLTKEDYDAFHERNPYLAAKLLNIFMEHPIVFMGYSLDDPNIQQILKSIIKILTRNNIDRLKERILFCEWGSQNQSTTLSDGSLLIGDTVLPIKLIKLKEYSEFLTVLTQIKRKIPVKVLRHMKTLVYDFVKTSDEKSKFYVAGDLDKLEDLKNGEFVYGIGLHDQLKAKGVKGLDGRDIIRDSIIDANLPSMDVCKLLLAPTTNQYLPYFKHLTQGDFLNDRGVLIWSDSIPEFTKEFVEKVNKITPETFYPGSSYRTKRNEINKKFDSIQALRKSEKDFLRQLMFIPLLDPQKIDLEQLRSFLKANIDSLVSSYHGTHFRKLVCLYDYLKYKYPLISR